MSGTLQVGPWARDALTAADYVALRQRIPDGCVLKLLQVNAPPPYGARLFGPDYVKLRDGWGRTPREAGEAALARDDECAMCRRSLARLPWVLVGHEGRIVAVCDPCMEKADEGADWETYA